jgi:pyruvate ferredoxin oxidoreductase gamma subunit
MTPDALIIQDPTLLHQVNLFEGLTEHGCVVVNSSRDLAELGLADLRRDNPQSDVVTVPATELALEHVGRPVPNAALLGGFSALSGLIKLESIEAAIRNKFPAKVAEANIRAARAAAEVVVRNGVASC